MKVYTNPDQASWREITRRPQLELGFLESSVRNILNRVRKSGDQALRELTLQLDKAELGELKATKEEIAEATQQVPPALREAIKQAADNITRFHRTQKNDGQSVETMPGVKCWRKAVPIPKVGIYIPGGTAPLF